MNPLWLAPATCSLAALETEVTQQDDGWSESAQLTITATGPCPWVDLQIPAGVVLDRFKARTQRSTGVDGKLDPDRLQPVSREVTGHGVWRLHVPELGKGDQLTIEMDRSWPIGPYRWDASGAAYAEIQHELTTPPPAWLNDDPKGAWTSSPDSGTWTLPHPGSASTGPSWALPIEPVQATHTVTLQIPEGDPMRSLHPGGRASQSESWTVAGAAGTAARAVVIPLPSDAADLEVQGAHTRFVDGIRLEAIDGQFDHAITYERPDAQTYGVRPVVPGLDVRMQVEGPNTRVHWEADTVWWLGSIGLEPLLPDRPRLVRALDKRLRQAAIPEPAIPGSLRGSPANWAFTAELRPALFERGGVGLPSDDPLFPRRLVVARRTGALTTVEAALTLWAQIGQAGIPVAWAIVQPAWWGPDVIRSPGTYTEGLVGIQRRGETRWIDPGCRMCAPFEIRPHLQGARMYSEVGHVTPEPVGQTVGVVDAAGVRTVQLSEAPALLLRQRLASESDRKTWLIEHIGAGGTPRSLEGLGDAGRPVVLTFDEVPGASGPFDWAWLMDTRAVPGDSSFLPWIGEVSWRRAGQASPAAQVAGDAWSWKRVMTPDGVEERLTVSSRIVPNSEVQAIRTAWAVNGPE